MKFIDRKASRPRENPVGEGTRANWMERNEENPRGQGIRASGRGEGRGWQQNLSKRRRRLLLYIFLDFKFSLVIRFGAG